MFRKAKGISEDVLKTTHPILNKVQSAEEADTVFNGISYGKGAAWLKQVYKVLGKDVLKGALHKYFTQFAWKNAQLNDFVSVLAETYDKMPKKVDMGTDFNFKKWASGWLTTSGVNVLTPVVSWDTDGSIKSLSIKQEAPKIGDNVLRSQVIDISLYDNDMNLLLIEDVLVEDKELTRVPDYKLRN